MKGRDQHLGKRFLFNYFRYTNHPIPKILKFYSYVNIYLYIFCKMCIGFGIFTYFLDAWIQIPHPGMPNRHPGMTKRHPGMTNRHPIRIPGYGFSHFENM